MDGWSLLVLVLGAAGLVCAAVFVWSWARSPGRVKAGYAAGLAVGFGAAVARVVLGGNGDGRWGLVAAALAVVVAVDVLGQVPRARPTSGRTAVAVVGWGVGAFALTPVVVGTYVARRVMGLPVFRGARVSR